MIRLVLPYPVSANRYWAQHVPRGWSRAVTYVTPAAKAYKRDIGWAAKQAGITAPVRYNVSIERVLLIPKNGIVMNLDNCLKITFDAMNGVIYFDDAQIKRIRNVEYAAPDGKGGLVVEIDRFGEPLPEQVALPLEVRAPELAANPF